MNFDLKLVEWSKPDPALEELDLIHGKNIVYIGSRVFVLIAAQGIIAPNYVEYAWHEVVEA